MGKALLNRLRLRGECLRVLVRRPSKALESDPLINQVCGDLGDPEAVDRAVAGVDIVYHVGAAMGGGGADFERGTVWGTKNIFLPACSMVLTAGSCKFHDGPRSCGTRHGIAGDGIVTTRATCRQARILYTVKTGGRANRSRSSSNELPADPGPGQIFGRGAEKVPPSGTIAIGRPMDRGGRRQAYHSTGVCGRCCRCAAVGG